ncbi:MAG: polymer-forming cytoskeletal protein [Leptospiraceae bacterium]|nr:polymer-forming cytoskeletal protein [Leptospiraceae bacterium]
MKQGPNYIRDTFVILDSEIISDEDLIIEGQVNTSKIDAKEHTCIVSLNAEINSDIHAGVIQIIGKVNGNIHASREITLADTAQVNGDLTAPRIHLSPRARLQGTISYN